MICDDCGIVLTAAERYYYEYRCESCERTAHQELVAWRNGEHNPKFDAMFGGQEEVAH